MVKEEDKDFLDEHDEYLFNKFKIYLSNHYFLRSMVVLFLNDTKSSKCKCC